MNKLICATLVTLALAAPAAAGEWKAVNGLYGKNQEHSTDRIVRRGGDNQMAHSLGMNSEMYYEYHPSVMEKLTGSWKAMLPPGRR